MAQNDQLYRAWPALPVATGEGRYLVVVRCGVPFGSLTTVAMTLNTSQLSSSNIKKCSARSTKCRCRLSRGDLPIATSPGDAQTACHCPAPNARAFTTGPGDLTTSAITSPVGRLFASNDRPHPQVFLFDELRCRTSMRCFALRPASRSPSSARATPDDPDHNGCCATANTAFAEADKGGSLYLRRTLHGKVQIVEKAGDICRRQPKVLFSRSSGRGGDHAHAFRVRRGSRGSNPVPLRRAPGAFAA